MTKNREIEAYPLSWPEGWQRTPKHLRKDGHHFKSGDVYEGSYALSDRCLRMYSAICGTNLYHSPLIW